MASWSLRFPGPGALASRMGARSSLTPLLGPLRLLCLGLVLPTAAAPTTGFLGCRDSPLGRVCFLSLSPASEGHTWTRSRLRNERPALPPPSPVLQASRAARR